MKRQRIKPRKLHGARWDHFGCPTCGNVYKLPHERSEEEMPWCTHGDNYSWRPPSKQSVARWAEVGMEGWTEMVRVDVYPREGS